MQKETPLNTALFHSRETLEKQSMNIPETRSVSQNRPKLNYFKVHKDRVIDTTGAGDAFCGGFIFELLNSGDDSSLFALENAIETAHGTAKSVIQMRGCDVSKILPVLSLEAGK